MQDRHVVTCLLAHRGRFALFKRSDQVSTYQGLWAGVSGTVDEGRTMVQQASVEIHEETGRTDARLMVTGAPVMVPSTDHEIRFIVHPFLFHLPSEDLRLNWEHTEARFVRVDELATFETVPSLRAVLDAVASPARIAQAIESATKRISADRTRGAGDLAAEALDALALVRLSRAMHGMDATPWRETAARLAVLRPGIEAIRTAVARSALDTATSVDEGAASEVLFTARDRILSARAAAARAATGWLEARGLRRILTLSRSAAVTAAIEAMDPDVEIRILESQPLGEGVTLARDLTAGGRAVQIVPDAAVFSALRGCSAGLIGADGILASGDVINKVGSAMVAAACKARGIPLLVIAEGFKAAPVDEAYLEEAEWEPGDTGQATRYAPLFERVPAALVDGIATEDGVATPAALAAAAAQLRDSLSASDLWALFYGTAGI